MAHLYRFRKGWQNENLARFILSRISFVAHPATVADDVGSDFYCTLFEIVEDSGKRHLIPRNAFAVQVKSNRRKFSVSNKASYFSKFEVPLFIGVVDQETLRLDIYSGEFLPMFFSYKGVTEVPSCGIRISKGVS